MLHPGVDICARSQAAKRVAIGRQSGLELRGRNRHQHGVLSIRHGQWLVYRTPAHARALASETQGMFLVVPTSYQAQCAQRLRVFGHSQRAYTRYQTEPGAVAFDTELPYHPGLSGAQAHYLRRRLRPRAPSTPRLRTGRIAHLRIPQCPAIGAGRAPAIHIRIFAQRARTRRLPSTRVRRKACAGDKSGDRRAAAHMRRGLR